MQQRKRIGDLLVEAGVLSPEKLQQALLEQKESRMRLGDLLVSRGYVSEQQFIEVLEFQLGIPHVQLFRQKIEPKVINLIPQRIAEQHTVLPLRIEGNRLIVAMADPLDYFAIDELRMSTGFRIEPALASKEELLRAIQRHYGLQENVDQIMQNLQTRDEEDYEPGAANTEEDSPVVRTVNQIILSAVHAGASDIHIDPQEDSLRIRFRVDGVMRTEQTLPPHMQGVIVARIKIMANMNVAERRHPQDGRVEMDVQYRKVDIRISTLPTIHGEKVVMRLLDMSHGMKDIGKLGFSEHNLSLFRGCIASAYGIVLITGPTGSGKTTTLYSALGVLNDEAVNIMTIEDPVEYQLHGINQMQVNSQAGVTFASGLRAMLRQDPNIIMVGEIRDAETAEIAIRAAMTGHLVLSTLHTNTAVNTVTRLIDMGIEPFLISSSLKGVVSQRLVRCVCTKCAVSYKPNPEEKELLEAHDFAATALRRGAGCDECGRTGYKGRIAIHEVLVLDDEMRSMILQRRSDNEYQQYAMKHGFIPMVRDGLAKVANGLTTVEEILRVTSGD